MIITIMIIMMIMIITTILIYKSFCVNRFNQVVGYKFAITVYNAIFEFIKNDE